MDIQAVIERLFSKTQELATKLEKLKLRNSELKEENRVLENQLNDYTATIGDLEMEIIELKQQLEGKKKK